jgi:hypothetical protein
MSFKHFFQFQDTRKAKRHQPAAVSEPQPSLPTQKSLCDIFREGIPFKEQPKRALIDQYQRGLAFFRTCNESRIDLAFQSFSLPMRHALYEILYLLHVNTPELKDWRYQVSESRRVAAEQSEKVVDLYLEGAPAGVKAIDQLSPVFRDDFVAYIQQTFHQKLIACESSEAPIEGVYSIGSIGTVGHKNIASDLDLEVQFSLEPAYYDTGQWNDAFLRQLMIQEHASLVKRYYQKKGVDPASVTSGEKRRKVTAFFRQRIAEKYPLIFQCLIANQMDVFDKIQKKTDPKQRYRLIIEVISLVKAGAQAQIRDDLPHREVLLRQRIRKIQDYVQAKFPDAEVYLFPFSRQDLQRGYFGSTLDSKESSGGAYELILNYETLMPGVYFTPVVPSHFLFSQDINNNPRQFEDFTQFIQFGLLDFHREAEAGINHQGPTPDLDRLYVAKHYSAAYWEAFKASSGNLPKATLNILRYEMLLEEKLGKSIIQLIKNPATLDAMVTTPSTSGRLDEAADPVFTPDAVIAMENEFPLLRYDPWWLRFKALKIAFGTPGLVDGLAEADRLRFIQTIDFAFALHVRLSDVFTKPGDQRKFVKHRDQVLKRFLDTVFPENSESRHRLQATFIGDVYTVAEFEKELRKLFLDSVDRIRQKVKKIDLEISEQGSEEFTIWHHYYEKSFKPKPNVVQKCILNHLQIPRGRLLIGYLKNKGWFFKSLQKGQSFGKRFESSIINLLPEEITLIENTFFLHGLVYCVVNGYYGIFNQGMLNETKTEVEYDRKHTNLGSKFDNQLAFVRPDQIERIMKTIRILLPERPISYLDCLNKNRVIGEVMVFLNLLKYGRISILYRDNLNTIYVDEFDIPKFVQHVDVFIASYDRMLRSRSLHALLGKFFKSRNIDIGTVELKAWVNTNSVETTHAATKVETKEADLAVYFERLITQIHRRRQHTEPTAKRSD